MENREATLKMLLGEKEIISMPSKMIFHTSAQGENDTMKIIFGGAGYVSNDIMKNEEDWARLDCEIIIIPKKIYKDFTLGKGARIQEMLLGGFARDECWEKSEEL